MRKQIQKVIFSLIFLLVFVSTIDTYVTVEGATVKEQFNVTDGVNYKDIRLSNSSVNQAIRVMEINVNDPHTKIAVGVPTLLNKLERTTTQALRYNQNGYTAVGAINASFFHLGTAMNLVSENNILIHSGEIYEGKDKYVNEPIAFGIDAKGQGIIDHYQLNMRYSHNGNNYSITSTNSLRYEDSTILYTPEFPSDYTNANVYGTEVVVSLPSALDIELGSTVSGTVTAVRQEGEDTKTKIPANGFVLSGNGKGSDELKNIKVGDPISLNVSIDAKWQNSSLILASGPMLVKDGKVSLSMDANSQSASAVVPRTAVAIDSTRGKVFFVTVDGRQGSYSKGMNLTQFANYLVSLGADRALNLDGGGSTTMAVRYPLTRNIALANSPSDGTERNVSTILMATSNAPLQLFSDLSPSHWASEPINAFVETGTIKGYPDKTFHPEESISRSHAAVLLARHLNLDTTNITDPSFKDVKAGDDYYKEIAAVSKAGLMNGREEGLFAKDGQLTRAELAVILQRAFDIPTASKSYYPDVLDTHYAYNAINAITENGLAGGYPDGNYKPSKQVNRAEFSVFLYRAN